MVGIPIESYDNEGDICSIECLKLARNNDSEMMLSLLSMRLCELKNTGNFETINFEHILRLFVVFLLLTTYK